MNELLMIAGALMFLGVTVTYGLSISGGGMSIQPQPVQRTGSGVIGLEEVLPASQSGSLTTRTSTEIGVITMSDASHGLSVSDLVDIYWDGGIQYGAGITAVSGDEISIDGGIGDDLPTQGTTVTVSLRTTSNITIDGDEAKLIAIELSTNTKTLRTAGHIQLVDASGTEIAEIDLITNVPQVWDLEGGSANPFTGNIITAAKSSQAGAVSGETYTLKILGVQDASP